LKPQGVTPRSTKVAKSRDKSGSGIPNTWGKFATHTKIKWFGAYTMAANALSIVTNGVVITHNSGRTSHWMFTRGGG